MPEVTLNAIGAAELGRAVVFLTGWISRDPARLGASLEDFAGNPVCDFRQLRHDLDRFTFLLGGSGGGPLSGLRRE